MDLINLSPASEKSQSILSMSMPAPLLPPIENWEGRLSISGDPFEKMQTQANLHNDPYECLNHNRAASGPLSTNLGDLEEFLQSDFMITPLDSNRAFIFCDISPIFNSFSGGQASLLDKGFLMQSSSALSGSSAKIYSTSGEKVSPAKSSENNAEVTAWHSIVAENQEDLTTQTPPPMFDGEELDDSLEDMKIISLDDIPAAEDIKEPECVTPPPPQETLAVTHSVNVEDLRRRMKDMLNKKVNPDDSALIPTDECLDNVGLERQGTFNIDKGTEKNHSNDTGEIKSPEEQKDTENAFLEKLKVICGEHNVSFVRDAADVQDNQSKIVLFMNDSSETGQRQPVLKRNNSFSSEIPRNVSVSSGRRRRSATAVETRMQDREAARDWSSAVNRALPSPQFRGKLKLRTAEVKPSVKVGPMRALQPQPKIRVDENETPPELVAKTRDKRKSLVATSTPKGDTKPVKFSTPNVNLAVKDGTKRRSSSRFLLPVNNTIRSRYSLTPSK
ncbi:uncharacterized protein LOC132262039 [Phlebotomus argentipes]|uniref:uncharacterized protein LOC132262039 n=1 Tax=Phlebotomus argentipes TaxID=94469 RepID=UPI0028929C24|nr:uncharacterized protein LOC132262039 [Phlebotomus argentipes]